MVESSNREKEIFLAALDVAAPFERAEFVVQACGHDEALRRRIEAMLQAYATPDSFLEKPAVELEQTVDLPAAVVTEPCLREGPGALVGPYKLIEQIGEGGMGVVFTAEQQEPVRRMVALKIIKPGMDSGQVLARFEAERQALALMDHPSIAKVLDAGATADSRPYFVMELVKGTPITTFCDENKLSPRERLELFIPICHAIQHAHQKGVIHRDIKPSNVLIAMYDDKPVPKVIDFGIAKAAGNPLTERTLHTAFGTIVGTPEYMSPEQATFNQLDIDTRSDVYSLGVLLYELLTGSTPVDKTRVKNAAILEVLRVVREEEPPRPSVKLSTTGARASIAATRGTEPNKLAQLLRGELDWIVMKSLEKDRNRRYETAAGLARDVDRFLNDDLVEARPPSLGYRLRKTVHKNRGTAIAASLLLMTLLGGVIGTTEGMLRAWDAEGETRQANDTIQANLLVVEGLKEKAFKALDKAVENERIAKENETKATAAVEHTARALTRSDGLRLLFQSELTRPINPSLAMLLAIEGAERNPGLLANNTLLAALDRNREERTLPVGGRSLALSSDGRWLAAVLPWTGSIWNLNTGREVARFAEDERLSDGTLFAASNHYFNGVCFEPNDKRVLTTSAYGRVRLWDAATGKALDLLIEGRMRGKWTAEDEANRESGLEFFAPAQFSPDGRFILTTHNKACLWDARTCKEHLVLEGHTAPVFWSSFSKDGEKIITASRDRTARIWDAASGKQLQVLKGQSTRALLTACFSPDGRRVLTVASVHPNWGIGNKDPLCRLWDAETGQELATLGAPHVGRFEPFPSEAQFSPDGSCVLTYDHFSMVEETPGWHLWDAKSGKHLGRIQTPGQAVFSPDGKRVALFGGKVLEVWNVKTIERIESLEHGSNVSAAIFSADGERLLTTDGTGLHIWAIAGEADRCQGRWTEFPFLAVSGDGRSLATRTSDPQEIAIWDLGTARQITRIKGKDFSEATFARFSPDGGKVIFGRHGYGYLGRDKDGTACVGDVRTGQLAGILPGGLDGLLDADIHPDNLRAVTINPSGRLLRLWNLVDGKELAKLKLAPNQSFCGQVRFSPDGRWLLTTEHSGHHIRSAATGQDSVVLKDHFPVNELDRAVFSPDGRHVLTMHAHSNPQMARVWNAVTGRALSTLRLPDRTGDYGTTEFSSDGAWIILACPDRTARIFETAAGKEILVLKGHESAVLAASISPDKSRVVTASADKTVRLWDARNGELQAVFQGHPVEVAFARFIPDGRVLSVDKAGSIRIWPVDALAASKARALRALTGEERKLYEVPTAIRR